MIFFHTTKFAFYTIIKTTSQKKGRAHHQFKIYFYNQNPDLTIF